MSQEQPALTLLQRVKRKARHLTGATAKPKLRYDVATYRTLRSLRQWQPDDVIVDVGANDGRTILRWREHLPATRIYAFEPVSSTFEVLRQQTAQLPDVHLFQYALGAEPQRRDIYVDNVSALSSFYADRTDPAHTETVEIDTVDGVLSREGLERVHLLKIDAEGHDLEVLKGAEQALADAKVELIQVEAGFSAPGIPMPSLDEFQQLLAAHGYYLHSINNQCRAKLSKYVPPQPGSNGPDPEILIYCDAIFTTSRSVA